jgi:hypothetical protein
MHTLTHKMHTLTHTHTQVKLGKTTTMTSIKASTNADFYTYTHGMHILFRGNSRCAGRAARIIAYDKDNACATIGSNDEVGDYDGAKDVATDVHPVTGACKGATCQGPATGGIRGAAVNHVSSVKILEPAAAAAATASCTTAMTLTAADGGGTGFLAKISAVSGGKIEGIEIINPGSGYTADPKLLVSDAACTCNGLAWNSVAANGVSCLKAIRGLFSDGGAACVAGICALYDTCTHAHTHIFTRR